MLCCGCRWIGGGRPRARHLHLNRCLTLCFPGGQKEPDYSVGVEAMRDRNSSPTLARGSNQPLGFNPSLHMTWSYSQNFAIRDFLLTLNFNGQASKGIVVSTPMFCQSGHCCFIITAARWSMRRWSCHTMLYFSIARVPPSEILYSPWEWQASSKASHKITMQKQTAVHWKADTQKAHKHL